MNENLKIWNAVKSIDKSKIKDANVGGHKCKSVNGVEMVKLLTEAIGPIGVNWSYEVLWERFDNEKPMYNGEIGEFVVFNGEPLWEQSHSAMVRFHVKDVQSGEWRSFEQMGHTPYRYGSGGNTYNGQKKPFKIVVDKEYGKKTITDATKKCMSLLGVAADVYSGDIDNYQYAAEVQDSLELKKADKSTEEESEQMELIKKEYDDAIHGLDIAPNLRAARLIYTGKMRFFAPRLGTAKFGEVTKKCVSHIEVKLIEITNKFEEDNKGEEK